MSFLQIIFVIMHGANYGQYYVRGRSWSSSSWIYKYLYNRCLITTNVVSSNPTRARLSVTCGRSVVFSRAPPVFSTCKTDRHNIIELVLLWAQLTKIYPPLPTSVQPISITKTLLIVPTKNERDPPLFTSKLLIKFQNILRNTIQVIIRRSVKILFSVISSPITLERQKWKSSKKKGILLSSPVNSL
jgi:hypothetical protein